MAKKSIPATRAVEGPGPEMPPFEELIPLPDVAVRLGVSRETVRRWTNLPENPLACWSFGQSKLTTNAALAAFAKSNRAARGMTR